MEKFKVFCGATMTELLSTNVRDRCANLIVMTPPTADCDAWLRELGYPELNSPIGDEIRRVRADRCNCIFPGKVSDEAAAYKMISELTRKGDTVLELNSGDGIIAKCCLKTGRKYICVEPDEEKGGDLWYMLDDLTNEEYATESPAKISVIRYREEEERLINELRLGLYHLRGIFAEDDPVSQQHNREKAIGVLVDTVGEIADLCARGLDKTDDEVVEARITMRNIFMSMMQED